MFWVVLQAIDEACGLHLAFADFVNCCEDGEPGKIGDSWMQTIKTKCNYLSWNYVVKDFLYRHRIVILRVTVIIVHFASPAYPSLLSHSFYREENMSVNWPVFHFLCFEHMIDLLCGGRALKTLSIQHLLLQLCNSLQEMPITIIMIDQMTINNDCLKLYVWSQCRLRLYIGLHGLRYLSVLIHYPSVYAFFLNSFPIHL